MENKERGKYKKPWQRYFEKACKSKGVEMRGIYFFRNDQRITDNPLLKTACSECEEIAFIAKAANDDWGIWRQKFYEESLHNLSINLKDKGHSLCVFQGSLVDTLNDLPKHDYFYAEEILTHYETEEVSCVPKEKLRSKTQDRLLGDLVSSLPDIFTEFRKRVEKGYAIDSEHLGEVLNFPKSLQTSLGTYQKKDLPSLNSKSAFPFNGGENAAHVRLQDYFFRKKNILTYKKTRNGMVGPSYSTKFSPYLALGNISPQRVFYEVERFEKSVKKNQDTYWVKFELWWREYFRWVFEKYPDRFFKSTGLKNEVKATSPNKQVFDKWINGQTGHDFIDANMIELKETGFMSNRGRQVVASYLVNDLKQPWMWGADYFEKMLIDYDVFSNWGNWQYVAGVGNDPRPNRYFHPDKQAANYDADSEFRRLWLD